MLRCWLFLLCVLVTSITIVIASTGVCKRDWQYDPATSTLPLEPLRLHPSFGTCGSRNSDVYYWPSTCDKANGTMDSIMQSFKDKTIAFIGDSITGQTLYFFLKSLELENLLFQISSEAYMHVNGVLKKQLPLDCEKALNHFCKNSIEVCNCTELKSYYIPAYRTKLINLYVYDMQVPSLRPTRSNFLPMALFERVVDLSDSAIVNAGLHFRIPSELREVNDYILRVLSTDKARNPDKKHVYRITLVTHFDTYYEWRAGVTFSQCVPVAFPGEGNENAALTQRFESQGIAVLDYNSVMSTRGHLHSEHKDNWRKGGIDCAHYCYSYELFYPFWQLLAKLT